MLTPTQKRYVDICTYKIANASTANKDIAGVFDITRKTVDLAIAWGRRNDLFRRAASDNIDQSIQEVRAHLKLLESEVRLYKRQRRKGDEIQSSLITGLSRELREWRIILMQLEGTYETTLKLRYPGTNGQSILPEKIILLGSNE